MHKPRVVRWSHTHIHTHTHIHDSDPLHTTVNARISSVASVEMLEVSLRELEVALGASGTLNGTMRIVILQLPTSLLCARVCVVAARPT